MAKSRLAPLRTSATIPRLKLSALTIGAKLTKFLNSQIDLPIQKNYIWSDSKVALMWTKCEKSLPIFISNRVKAIKTNAPTAVLRFLPGDQNPSGIGSRGMMVTELIESKPWFHGPPLLHEPENRWPEDISHIPVDEKETEKNS
ncbi:unnamed protein product [Nippostrongylus brasiliensis]|uniref:DUF5641 domain-containing protein n=1 Tax=Nippostrongylus brasiliensis TaxID=27835 RepID=A0A0N4YDC2_NIPBR|nr:unnamed protein product [Nippostrongylus brasiliensis]